MHSQCKRYVYDVNTLCTVRSKGKPALRKIAFHFVFVCLCIIKCCIFVFVQVFFVLCIEGALRVQALPRGCSGKDLTADLTAAGWTESRGNPKIQKNTFSCRVNFL